MNAIFYLTYNGVFNCTNGICTQTKTILNSIQKNYRDFAKVFGDFHFYIICPESTSTEKFNDTWVFADGVTKATGGSVIEIKYGNRILWSIESWKRLSKHSANVIENLAKYYKQILVISVDTPFLQTALNLERKTKKYCHLVSIIVFYSTAYQCKKSETRKTILKWERQSINFIKRSISTYIGEVSTSSKMHLIDRYGASLNKFIPYSSSLSIRHSDFKLLSLREIESTLRKFGIPLDKNLVFACGRPTHIKGFDILLQQFNLIQFRPHLVLILVPYNKQDVKMIELYRQRIEDDNINCSLFIGFNREIPKAICQYKNTKLVIVPSRHETFSNIPFEVSLWAKRKGPICLSSNIDSFKEQIIDGYNGFTFDLKSKTDLASKANSILSLTEAECEEIRNAAYKKTVFERDFKKNFILTLNHVKSKL